MPELNINPERYIRLTEIQHQFLGFVATHVKPPNDTFKDDNLLYYNGRYSVTDVNELMVERVLFSLEVFSEGGVKSIDEASICLQDDQELDLKSYRFNIDTAIDDNNPEMSFAISLGQPGGEAWVEGDEYASKLLQKLQRLESAGLLKPID